MSVTSVLLSVSSVVALCVAVALAQTPSPDWKTIGDEAITLLQSYVYESAPGKAILLLNHMDVVPADRAEWKMDPFAALVRGGDLWGRGALDMKALGIAEFLAFRQLKRDRVPLDASARPPRFSSKPFATEPLAN